MNKDKLISVCPSCGSKETILQYNDFTKDAYYDRLSCDDCGCVWQEVFRYESYEILEKPLDENSLKV